MITVKSYSLGCVTYDESREPHMIYRIRKFKKYGFLCKAYIFIQSWLEDYIEVIEE